jgi:hypothetical protein
MWSDARNDFCAGGFRCLPAWALAALAMRPSCGAPRTVKELLRTNDAVLITAIEALLKGAGIECMIADRHMSVLEGSLGVLPRRVLVADEEADEAKQLLTEAGLGHAIT